MNSKTRTLLLYLLPFASLTIVSCATPTGISRRASLSAVTVPTLGVYILPPTDAGVEVGYVEKNGPGWDAGIRNGNIIVKMDGVPVHNRKQFLDLIRKRQANDIVKLSILRNDTPMDVQVKLGSVTISKDIDRMMKILSEGKQVRLAIVVGQIQNLVSEDAMKLAQWKEAMKSNTLSSTESTYQEAFRLEKNFTIVDRTKVEILLQEMKFGMSGMVSEELRNELGHALAATHILFIEICRFPASGKYYKDVETRRLIEVESGKVLASAVFENVR